MAEKKASVVKVSKELLDMLNQGIAREIQVAIQYMWQHVQWGGVKGFAVQMNCKSIAIAGNETRRNQSPRDCIIWAEFPPPNRTRSLSALLSKK